MQKEKASKKPLRSSAVSARENGKNENKNKDKRKRTKRKKKQKIKN